MTLRRDKLRVELRVHNPGPDSFDFAAALHSYFEVVDAGLPAVRVTGLKARAPPPPPPPLSRC